MKGVFVTATGTDIGKTYLLEHLIPELALTGLVRAIKPLISGFESTVDSDLHRLLRAQKIDLLPKYFEEIACYRFSAPLSPDQAASQENKKIQYEVLIDFCLKELNAKEEGLLFIEGIGGIMVPLNAEKLVIDWIGALKIPVLLIAGSYLGSLSHTLTAIHALKTQNIKILAVLVNESRDSVGLDATCNSLSPFAKYIPILSWKRGAIKTPHPLKELLQRYRFDIAN
ncbi:MAG TPA: dethiobiotin synthase [Gammaproteobacteria bacterium]|nr:dethiobiotin synthase [Gammaproteobacteria bacterium]